MDFHVKRWLQFLENEVYRSPLEPEDYIFPALASNGTAHRGASISHDVVEEMISLFSGHAGIILGNGRFTTHCYRRGGAQYRFMFAPMGKRWSLAKVRWWGGWAENEQVNLMLLSVYHND